MKKIAFSCFVYEEGKSGIAEYITSVLSELSQKHLIIIHITKHEARFLKEKIPESNNIYYKCYNDILQQPVLNLLFHTFIFPFILLFSKTNLLYLPAANRRQMLFYPKFTIGIVHDLAELHLTEKFGFLRWLRMKFFTPLFLKKIHRIIAVSNTTKNDLTLFYKIPAESITVAYNGIKQKNTEQQIRVHSCESVAKENVITPVNNSTFNIQNSKFILYVSRIEHPGKNHIKLIEAYESLSIDIRSEYDLVFAGNLKENHQTVIERIEKSPCKKNIHLYGFVSNEKLIELYKEASLYICPSLYEGFGLTPVEAMSYGIPVASSTAGALPEVCGECAAYFNPHSTLEIQNSITMLLYDPVLRTQLVEKAYKHIQKFNWEVHVSSVLQEI